MACGGAGDLLVIPCVPFRISGPNHAYLLQRSLEPGAYGQIWGAVREEDGEFVAIKIARATRAADEAARVEQAVAMALERSDPAGRSRVIRLLDSFRFSRRLCLVYPWLQYNLFEHLQSREFQGLPMSRVQQWTRDILAGLLALHSLGLVHGDIKPENVMADGDDGMVVIDLGATHTVGDAAGRYIQSRYYRAIEVMLGVPHARPVDMWSVGCCIFEMFCGIPAFPGYSEFEMFELIAEWCGPVPLRLLSLAAGRVRGLFDCDGRFVGQEVIWRRAGIPVERRGHEWRRTLETESLEAAIRLYGFWEGPIGGDRERAKREELIDLVRRCLALDPEERIGVDDALRHPFLADASI